MDRKKFLKLFGLGVAGLATAKIVIEETKKIPEKKYIAGIDPCIVNKPMQVETKCGPGILAQVQEANGRYYTMFTGEQGYRDFHKALNEATKHYILNG